MTDPWLHRLSDYLDDEMVASERTELEEHLLDCEVCTTTLAELDAMVAQAKELPMHSPPQGLWSQIAEQLDDPAAEEPQRTVVHHASPAPRVVQFSMQQMVAACVSVLLLSGAMGWLGASLQSRNGAPLPVAETTQGPIAQIDRPQLEASPAGARQELPLTEAMKAYQESIQQLETALKEQEDTIDPDTLEIIQENLRVIDTAIFDSRLALMQDPESEYLHAHLATSIKKKIRLLRQANRVADGGQI